MICVSYGFCSLEENKLFATDSNTFGGKKCDSSMCRGADKSLARSGRKQATAAEDFDFHISYL